MFAGVDGASAEEGWYSTALLLENLQSKNTCGPCDESTKTPSAGVGVAAKDTDNIVVVQAQRNIENFQNAWLAGRVEKYEVDQSWEANLAVYVLYGKS